jgi:hypothetical protein
MTLQALLRVFLKVIPCSLALSKHKELLSFLVNQRISKSYVKISHTVHMLEMEVLTV